MQAEGKKLGGILTELSINPKTGLVDYAIIGIGINCLQEQGDFPEEIRDIAISLKTATGKAPSLPKIAAAMVEALWKMDITQKKQHMDRYREICITIGQEINLIRGEEIRQGTALDISDDGLLLVRFPDGKEEWVSSGEVSCRKAN